MMNRIQPKHRIIRGLWWIYIITATLYLWDGTIASSQQSQAVDHYLTYQSRGNRHEGIIRNLSSVPQSFDMVNGISLVSATGYNDDIEYIGVPNQINIGFYLPQDLPTNIRVQNVSTNPKYFLDKVIPPSPWLPTRFNFFSWDTGDVLIRLNLIQSLKDLGIVAQLLESSNTSPYEKDQTRRRNKYGTPNNAREEAVGTKEIVVAPVILYSTNLPEKINTIYFIFRLKVSNSIKFDLYSLSDINEYFDWSDGVLRRREKKPELRFKNVVTSWPSRYESGIARLKWMDAGNRDEGWYYLAATNTRTDNIDYGVIFYHRRMSTENEVSQAYASLKQVSALAITSFQLKRHILKTVTLSNHSSVPHVITMKAFLPYTEVAYDAQEVKDLLKSGKRAFDTLSGKYYEGIKDYLNVEYPSIDSLPTFPDPSNSSRQLINKRLADGIIDRALRVLRVTYDIPSVTVNINVNSLPEPEAKVELLNLKGDLVNSLITNYGFIHIPRGNYLIRASKPGYKPVEKKAVSIMRSRNETTMTCRFYPIDEPLHASYCNDPR